MAVTFVSAAKTATATLAVTINAGEALIIIGGDEAAQGSVLSLSDTLGNSYVKRGSKNDTYNNATRSLFDCLTPITGSTTLTLSGAATPNFIVLKYTGLATYSAGSFSSAFFGASPPISTDGCATAAITPTAYPALLVGLSLAGSGTVLAPGTGFTSRLSTSNGMAFADAGNAEDLELATGSHLASFTMSSGGNSVTVIGAAYLESTFVPFMNYSYQPMVAS